MPTAPSVACSAFPPSAMSTVLELATRFATLPEDILLVGPTGSGKGHLANYIHQASGRSGQFIPVTGGELTDTLWATQLFGHVAGAYTDAKERSPGAFELAAGGTLFLDELHHWSQPVQHALLQPLETREFRPLGANRVLIATCRILFGTTMSPDQLHHSMGFPRDLLHRLPALQLELPALSDRQEEILPLADHFATRILSAWGWERVRFRWDRSAVRALLLHAWPGNIRELRWVLKRTLGRVGPFPLDPISSSDLRLIPGSSEPFPKLLTPAVFDQVVQWALRHSGGRLREAAALLGVHRNSMAGYRRHLAAPAPDAQRQGTPRVQDSRPTTVRLA